METFSNAAKYALQFVNQTNKSIFLTGRAGTGKTTLLREIVKSTFKNTAIVAPTGIAALNAGGVTVHSLFQLPFAAFVPTNDSSVPNSFNIRIENRHTLRRHFKMSASKKSVLRNLDLLIIDEVSMLRPDLLDAIDFMLQTVRKDDRPFGGIQVLYIGDLLQLPPVIKHEEWSVLKSYYSGKFFFHSHVIREQPPLYIELTKIYRQTDDTFISLLNNLRNNKISKDDIAVLNRFVQPDFKLQDNPGYILLTTHNAKADAINNQALDQLSVKEFTYEPEIVGDFPEKICPLDAQLRLKVGAQIMFIKNDLSQQKNYFNGKSGVIKSLSSREITVHFPDENLTIDVEQYEWQNIRYVVDPATKEITEDVLGTFVQYPIKLAWAITVHKSQGLTFDKAALDVSQVFLPGQAYVALSRLRSLNGLILLSQLQMNGISNDQDVMLYADNKADDEKLEISLSAETRAYVQQSLSKAFNWATLIHEWRTHKYSYVDVEKSEKAKNKAWANQQYEALLAIDSVSRSFVSQINQIFKAQEIDLGLLQNRIFAAVDYFFPILDAVLSQLLLKIEEVKRAKKSKTFFNELYNLEEVQAKAVLTLMRSKLLAKVYTSGQEISRENLESVEIKNHRRIKLEKIQSQFADKTDYIFNENHSRYAPAKAKKEKIAKKSTTEETFELYKQNLSLSEIAEKRKLTKTTISNHFAKLIEEDKIKLSDVMSATKIDALEVAFAGKVPESLTALKESFKDEFSWDELKLFKAHLVKTELA